MKPLAPARAAIAALALLLLPGCHDDSQAVRVHNRTELTIFVIYDRVLDDSDGAVVEEVAAIAPGACQELHRSFGLLEGHPIVGSPPPIGLHAFSSQQ